MKDTVKSLLNKRKQEKNKEEMLFIDSILDCDSMDEEEVISVVNFFFLSLSFKEFYTFYTAKRLLFFSPLDVGLIEISRSVFEQSSKSMLFKLWNLIVYIVEYAWGIFRKNLSRKFLNLKNTLTGKLPQNHYCSSRRKKSNS